MTSTYLHPNFLPSQITIRKFSRSCFIALVCLGCSSPSNHNPGSSSDDPTEANETYSEIVGTEYEQLENISSLSTFHNTASIRDAMHKLKKDESASHTNTLGISTYERGDKKLILLNEYLAKEEGKPQRYKIIDAVKIDAPQNQIAYYSKCNVDGITETAIIILISLIDDPQQEIKAWYANLKTSKLIAVSDPESISCTAEKVLW